MRPARRGDGPHARDVQRATCARPCRSWPSAARSPSPRERDLSTHPTRVFAVDWPSPPVAAGSPSGARAPPRGRCPRQRHNMNSVARAGPAPAGVSITRPSSSAAPSRTAPAAAARTGPAPPAPGPRSPARRPIPGSRRFGRRTRTGRFATTGPSPAPRRRAGAARRSPGLAQHPQRGHAPARAAGPARPRPRPRRARRPPTSRAPEPGPPPPRPAARATSRAPATSPPRRSRPPAVAPADRPAGRAQPRRRAAPAAGPPSTISALRTDDDVREQRERVPRDVGRPPRRQETATARPPGAGARQPAARPQHRNDDHAAVKRRRVEAGRQLRGGAGRASPRRRGSRRTTLTRGPALVPTTTHAGIDGAPPPARVARRQRDGDGARLARSDRDAADPDTAGGELDEHV